MENLLLNGLPVPLADIKDMDDCIIQEMNFKLSNEEIVNQWDTKIRRKIASKLSVCKNEKVFEDVLKDYLRLLKEQAKNFKEKKVLKDKISCHLKVFHLLCYSTREHVGLYMVNYLDYIENILIVLCNLELEVIRQLKKNHVGKEYNKTVKRVARRLIDNLSVNLINEERRICHVLLKLDSKHEQSWKDVMHIVYNHYLINLPVRDRSDLSFCRCYLLFQKWKSITDKNKHQVMDKIMYLKFDKTPESITNNPLLKSILLPSTECLVDLVDVLTNGQQVTINAYFKYIEGRYEEDEIRVPQAIELDSDEDEDITQKLLFEPSESEKRRNGLIKSEKRSKTPVQENARYVEISSSDGQVVCVIDDDSDIEEVCVQDNRSNRRRKLGHKAAPARPVVSFLDSICLPDDDSSSPIHTCSIEKETAAPPTPPAESTTLPIVTAYIDSVRRKGALIDADTQETSTIGMESLSISVNVQKEVACLTDVLNTVSCRENVEDSVHYTRTTSKDIPGDSSNNKNNNSNSVVQDACVQSVVSPHSSDSVISKEVQSTNESEKCTCCCRHSANTNNSSSHNTQSETNNSNKSVTKPNLKTVEIQTENMDSFNYLCGMITPPSDRTADENSPSSIETCSETEIHNNNSLHSGNTNVYAYVPSMTATEPYIENNAHNHYESDVETHSNPYLGVCESSTQVYNFDQPGDTQSHNESLLEESNVQSLKENIHEPNSNSKESLEIPIPAQIEQSNQEEKTPTEELINEIELSEEPVSEIQLNETENVAELEKEGNENGFDETGLEEQTNENGFNEIQVEEQVHEFERREPEEKIIQNEFDETEAAGEFNDACMDDLEEVASELGVDDTHIDDTDLVSEIELHEEALTEVLPEVGVSENEILNENEQVQERSELEEHSRDTVETNDQEGDQDHSMTNKEYQISNSIEESCASNEPETIVNNITNDINYSDLSTVPVIIAETQNTDLQESAIDIIPFELINTVIVGDRYIPDKEIVLVPSIGKDGAESTKFTMYKIATEVSEESLIDNTEGNQLNNSNMSISMQPDKVLNEKEPTIAKDSDTAASEAQSCKIQASVTMAQLLNKTSSKAPKNGEHVKMTRKKNAEENVDKIIFTSNERVKSAPLSLFAKFEQSQSDLVENAFSGPIEPINGRTNITCDNSNSNDSFCLFDSDRSTVTKDFSDNNIPTISPDEGGSPISPPYENIHAQEYENHILNVHLESLCAKDKNVTQKKSSTTKVKRKEDRRLNSATLAVNVERKNQQKLTSDTLAVNVQHKEQRKFISDAGTIDVQGNDEERLTSDTLTMNVAYNEEETLNSESATTNIEHIEEERLNSDTLPMDIERIEEETLTSDSLTANYEDYEESDTVTANVERNEENTLNSDTQNTFEMPTTTSIMSNNSTSKRKHSDDGETSKKIKVNFGRTEIRFIPPRPRTRARARVRARVRVKGKVNKTVSMETMLEHGIGLDDLKLMHLVPAVVVELDSPEELKRTLHKLYVNSILNNLLFEKKIKAEDTCIMTRVDYKKPTEDNQLRTHVEGPSSPPYSHSAESSAPGAITKRVATPRISGILPPSGYIPALNSAKSGLKKASDCSQDPDDYGNYNSDSRARTRRKRTPTPKAQKPPLLKTSTEPSSSKAQKRRRGRPKKSETTKSPNNGNLGVLYADGPFRLG